MRKVGEGSRKVMENDGQYSGFLFHLGLVSLLANSFRNRVEQNTFLSVQNVRRYAMEATVDIAFASVLFSRSFYILCGPSGREQRFRRKE